MTLKEFRKLFVRITGRYDLVEDTKDYKDNGLNFLVQAGQRLLDSKFKHSSTFSKLPLELKKNTEQYVLNNYLSVTNVQVNTSDSGQVTLEKVDEDEFAELSNQDSSGIPRIYTVVNALRTPITGVAQGDLAKLAIKVFPQPDQDMEAHVTGRLSTPLQGDSDYNFWTVNYPEILVTATQYQIEVFHRNTQGANDHMIALERLLWEIEADKIESEVADHNQMRDSFKFRGKGNAR